MDRRRHKPARVQVKAGEKWLSADLQETAIVTSVYSATDDLISTVQVRFLYVPRVGSSASAELEQGEFRMRFPIRGD